MDLDGSKGERKGKKSKRERKENKKEKEKNYKTCGLLIMHSKRDKNIFGPFVATNGQSLLFLSNIYYILNINVCIFNNIYFLYKYLIMYNKY